MLSLRSDTDCMVCGSCILECPQGCITFRLNDINYEPYIENDRCIGCRKCEIACDNIHKRGFVQNGDINDSRYFVCASKDKETLKESSSGGMFTEFAKETFNNNGCVIAAAFNPDTKTVDHICVADDKALKLCKKSKYVQSNQQYMYSKIEETLKRNEHLMVVGTPCQIAPIFKKYGNQSDILFVDLFCHGVSNAGVFKTYLESFDKGIKWVDFRYESPTMDNYNFNFNFNDHTILTETCDDNVFYRLFISSANLKKSCFDCEFSEHRHMSDITIGDWDYHEYAEEHGINVPHPSIAVVNTKKGMDTFDSIKDQIDFYEVDERDKKIISYYPDHNKQKGSWGYNYQLVEPFIKDYRTYGFYAAAYKSLEKDNLNILSRIHPANNVVWLYGSGGVGRRALTLIRTFHNDWNVKGFIDSANIPRYSEVMGLPVVSLSKMTMHELNSDIFIITSGSKYREDMSNTLLNTGVDKKRIFAIKE